MVIRALAALALTVALTGAPPQVARASVVIPPDPGIILSFANCFDACTLSVVLDGNGSGTWKSTNSSHVPNGLINCAWLNGALVPGSDCTETYCCVDRVTAVRVYFTLTPATGSSACYLSTCSLTSIQDYKDLPSTDRPITTTIGGGFNLNIFLVTVSRSGTGTGGITSLPGGISCPGYCSDTYLYGANVTLKATAATGSYFAGWSGACAGQPSDCDLTITEGMTTDAIFTLGSPPTASPPAATPVVTPTPPRPTGTPKPAKTGSPTASQPTSTGTAVTSSPPGETSAASGDTAGLPTVPGSSGTGSTQPFVSEPPAAPAGSSGTDLTPIALAILGAGLLIAIGIGVAAVLLTRRRGAPPA